MNEAVKVVEIGTTIVGTGAVAAGSTAAAIGATSTVMMTDVIVTSAAAGAAAGGAAGAGVVSTVAGWFGIPIAHAVVVTTAPAWALPVAIGGGVLLVGAGASYALRRFWRK